MSEKYNPHKISSVFSYEDLSQRRSLQTTWDKIYNDQDEQRNLLVKDKHILYYEVFKNLGFFKTPSKTSPLIMQAGLGHGNTLKNIIQTMERIIPLGLDISFFALKQSKTNGLNNLIQADILNLPIADNKIDAIFEVGVVEHLYQDDPFLGKIVDRETIIKSFKELKRILKPQGKVGFIQPSLHSVLPQSKKIDIMLHRWKMDFQEDFALNDFCQLLAIAGFSEIKYVILQAPSDFPLRIKIGDKLLKSFYALTGQNKKAELTGALFAVVGTKL